jgi:hypothetical protein
MAAGVLGLGALAANLSTEPAGIGSAATDPAIDPAGASRRVEPDTGCIRCHEGIEDMHPGADLSCTDCHGGDGAARSKFEAHVHPLGSIPDDESVPRLTEDLAWRRFRNPMDLRVAKTTCEGCHPGALATLRKSLHGTTAGHLSDGFYEMGLTDERESRYAIFPERERPTGEHEVGKLIQVPAFRHDLPKDELSTHYTDLARKECMQCHLWSEGRAVRGRVGFDGDYRGSGCAACHVRYSLDGLTDSADPTVARNEPGHAARHEMTRAPSTDTCVSCHYGDASIGLHFRGLSQLPPGAPGGPEIAGTTDRLLNRSFYIDDPGLTPPDVHHERGMHCIDCHTQGDVMGDGRMVGAMEHAVEISCSDCHGTFDEPSRLVTARGTPLEHLVREGDDVFLISKVTGERHRVSQVAHVLDPEHDDYNERAAAAMTSAHEGIECYTCHAGWNVNFLGFHFDRNESLSQLDLLTGGRTPGRVTTQEKVFATWKSFYAGYNEAGRVAPYLTGFSTMGSFTNKDGERVLDQVMPETAAGLSGMTMIHHQLHSTRPTARSCVECHRTSSTWGLGSSNFRLSRSLAFAADRRGIEVIALNRGALAASTALTKFVLPDVTCMEILADPIQGHAQYLFVGEGGRGTHVLDVRDPTQPERVAFIESVGPRGMTLAGTVLYVADGSGGLRGYDVSDPTRPHLMGLVPMFEANDVYVQWPWAYVADGPAGLCIVDVRAPIAPRVISVLAFDISGDRGQNAIDVEVMFQYSRPLADEDGPLDERTPARNLCAVLDEANGLILVDVTEPTEPVMLSPVYEGDQRSRTRARNASFRGITLMSHVDLAERQGGQKTAERDYVYLLYERGVNNRQSFVEVYDVEDPTWPKLVGRTQTGSSTEMLEPAAFYNTPFLQTVMFAPGEDGVLATDVTVSAEPNQIGALPAIQNAYVMAVESFPLDRMLDAQGRRLKDVSHEDSRWLYLSEIYRILTLPASKLGPARYDDEPEPVTRSRDEGLKADPANTARLVFQQSDADRSGFLDADEAAAVGGLRADVDGNGLLSLAELCDLGGGLGPRRRAVPEAPPRSQFLATRVDADGDLSRLFDGTDPHAHDVGHDGKLNREETTRALFDALDLDDDRKLTIGELSRHPGKLRELRFGGEQALRAFEAIDDNKDDRISPRELTLRDEEWRALDVNADGYVQLEVNYDPDLIRRGLLPPPREWPTRQPNRIGLPPGVSSDLLLKIFDADEDGKLSRREMKRRPQLRFRMDGDGSSSVEEDELARAVAFVVQGGVEVTPDGFAERWDLDGDGKVEPEEIELMPWLRERLLGKR